ncbi:hypothetical protein [Methylocella sp.]|uniref:bestrophin-like domain n=1 Tax=Methylocella sp. TaxID=1978226 RepID=UPI003C206329
MTSPFSPFVWLAEHDLRLFALALFALLAAAAEIGFRIGRARAARLKPHEKAVDGVATLTMGMLALVAFSLGLTISFAQSRYEARRLEVVEEANSIGTAWLRAKLIGGEEGEAIAAQIVDYTRARLDYTRADFGSDEHRLIDRTNELQSEMWQTVTPLARRTPTPIVSLVTALNDMFDQSLVQRTAFESRAPQVLSIMLLCGSMLSLGALGFQFGLGGRRPVTLGSLLLVMWVGAMVLIVDFNRPRLGTLRVDPSPLIWTLNGFSSPPAAN